MDPEGLNLDLVKWTVKYIRCSPYSECSDGGAVRKLQADRENDGSLLLLPETPVGAGNALWQYLPLGDQAPDRTRGFLSDILGQF
jgi:hypothetical protein